MVKAINRVVDSASNGFGASNSVITTVKKSGTGVVIVFAVLAVVVVAAYIYFGRAGPSRCPKTLHRNADGSLKLNPSGQTFPDMNAFQQWWHSSGENAACPLPVLTGAREVPVLTAGTNVGPTGEQTYAKTPIYKVDDYEFSRIFGYERDGHMDVPRQNFNMILNDRTFDWADKPMSSDERKGKYAGLVEGFTAAGELKSEASRHEAVARYGEKRHGSHGRHTSRDPTDQEADVDCKISREAKEVASMVAKAYENDPDWEPIVSMSSSPVAVAARCLQPSMSGLLTRRMTRSISISASVNSRRSITRSTPSIPVQSVSYRTHRSVTSIVGAWIFPTARHSTVTTGPFLHPAGNNGGH